MASRPEPPGDSAGARTAAAPSAATVAGPVVGPVAGHGDVRADRSSDREGRALLARAAELVAVPSVSRSEQAIADLVQAVLSEHPELHVERLGDSVVARTALGRSRRVVLAGHLDTVPPFEDPTARVEGDVLWGLGSVDMKGGLAVLLDLATTVVDPAADVTWVFYACEEIDRSENALAWMAAHRPDVLAGDAAVLLEPTGGVVEAGCQGTARVEVRVRGRRAHTARPWMGVNAVHRLAGVLDVLNAYRPRQVELDGCVYTEQLQAVRVTGGVAGNVVPDDAAVTVNFRFAPDRDVAGALAALEDVFRGALGAGGTLEVTDIAGGAPPGLGHPVLAALVEATGTPARAKLGWTDVATFASAGVPAVNFGPGDPLLAHTPDEHVSAAELVAIRRVLGQVIGEAARRGV